MTDQERNQVLRMIEEGKITPEEGLKLIQTLEQSQPDEGISPAVPPAEAQAAAEPSGLESDPRIARVKSTARRLWQVPLWIGIAVVVASALGMYSILQGPGMNFWFYCLSMPLLLGVLLLAAAVGSRKARWIFVDVRQKPGEKPQRIFLGFPLPLKFTGWFLRTFRHKIPELDRDLKADKVDQILDVFDAGFTGDEPLIVNVDEGEDGEKVQVYIG